MKTGFRRRARHTPEASPDRMSDSSLSIGSESNAEPVQTGFRRRASSAPSPSPDRKAPSVPTAIEEPALEPVVEATAEPAPKKKERSSKTVAAAASVFSSIFGDEGDSLQPLAPDAANEDLSSTRPLGEGSSKAYRRRKDR